MSPSVELGVRDESGRIENPVCGNPVLLQRSLEILDPPEHGAAIQLAVEKVRVLAAQFQGGEARLGQEGFTIEDSTQCLPLHVVRDGNGNPDILPGTRVAAVGCVEQIAIARPGRVAAIDRAVEKRGGEEMKCRFGLGDIDVLALPGAAPVFDGREQGRHAEFRHDVVRIGTKRPRRWTIGPARQIEEPGKCRGEISMFHFFLH